MLQARVDAQFAPGLVVGLIDTNGTKIIAAGKTAAEGGAAVDGDTLFEIGSVTKVFTATLLADMVQRGEVRLDDPIVKYLPAGLKVPSIQGRQITLLDLAQQRSGLPRLPDNLVPRDDENPYVDYTFENLCDFLSDYTLPRAPGKKYEYSNLGFGLLGTLLARRAGTNYEALVTERIFRPLQLAETGITLPPALPARLAAPNDGERGPCHTWEFDALAGAGAIRSSARDLLRFLAANLQLTKTPLAAAMQSMQAPLAPTDEANTRIGLAWHVTQSHGRRLVWHNGETGGYHAFIGFDPTNKTGVVVLANSNHGEDDLGFYLLDTKRKLRKPQAATDAALTTAQLDALAGQFELAPGAYFTIRREGAHLMAQLTGQPFYRIYARSSTNFFYKVVDAQLDFHSDSSGRADSLTLHQNGADRTAPRITAPVPPGRHAILLEPKALEAYVGQYEFSPDAVLTVRRDRERLIARLTGQNFVAIYPSSPDEFFYQVVDAQLSFVRTGGQCTGVVLHQNGVDQKAVKTK